MARKHHLQSWLVRGFFAGTAAAAVTALAWPGVCEAAPAATKPAVRANKLPVCEAKAADQTATTTILPQDLLREQVAVVAPLLLPLDYFAWPSLAALDMEIANMDGLIHVALPQLWPAAAQPFTFAAMLGQPTAWPGVTLQEQPDAYILHIKAPGEDLSKVKVQVDGQRVQVRYANESATQQVAANDSDRVDAESTMSFEESVSLAKPVNARRMRRAQHGDELDVTLPKVTRSRKSPSQRSRTSHHHKGQQA